MQIPPGDVIEWFLGNYCNSYYNESSTSQRKTVSRKYVELLVFFFNLRALFHFFTRVRAMGRRRRAKTPSGISIDGASLLVLHNGSP